MENINEFLEINHTTIKNIIAEFNPEKEFSSHDFIEKFSSEFEYDYINMLVLYQKENYNTAFQTVHRLIAKFLSSNMSSLGIKKIQRKGSENVHVNISNPQWWKRS